MKALVSIYDKSGQYTLVRALHERGISLLATSGTAKALAKHGIPCAETKGITGFENLLDGRIKTIHPHVHEAIATGEIDIVIVGLMPVDDPDAPGLSMMDLGGVLLLRSAIKNHDKVLAVACPTAQEDVILAALDGQTPVEVARRRCALEAMEAVVAYEKKTQKRLLRM